MISLTSLSGFGGDDNLTPDEIKLLKLFKGQSPGYGVYVSTMKGAFERVEDLENAQAGLSRRGYLDLKPIPHSSVSRLDRVQNARLSLDGYRKLQEIAP